MLTKDAMMCAKAEQGRDDMRQARDHVRQGRDVRDQVRFGRT